MKPSRIITLILAALIAATATSTLPAQETQPAGLECEGDGLIYVVPDQCMHDGGASASGDSLEVYCYDGTARFCLSGEECPWRGAPAGPGDETCSPAGLDVEWMASAWCEGWSGYYEFACTEGGQIKLQKESKADMRPGCGEPD